MWGRITLKNTTVLRSDCAAVCISGSGCLFHVLLRPTYLHQGCSAGLGLFLLRVGLVWAAIQNMACSCKGLRPCTLHYYCSPGAPHFERQGCRTNKDRIAGQEDLRVSLLIRVDGPQADWTRRSYTGLVRLGDCRPTPALPKFSFMGRLYCMNLLKLL